MDFLNESAERFQYHYLMLSNLMKVILIRNFNSSTGSISLSIDLGSNNDPIVFPGLSHFLEKTILPETTFCSKDSAFHKFIEECKGSFSSYTLPDTTVYSCTSATVNLDKLAEEFSNIFVNPSIDKNVVGKAVDFVHSKFMNQRNSSFLYKNSVSKIFTRKFDPRGKFILEPEKTSDAEEVMNSILQHYANSYSSDRMCLVITGDQPIEYLTEVAKRFESIKNLNKPAIKRLYGPSNYCFYDPQNYRNIVKIKTESNKNELCVSLNTLCALCIFDQFPLQNLKFLIEKTEENSISSILISKGLITKLSLEFSTFKGYSTVDFLFELTENGLKEYTTVLDTFAEYLSTLKANLSTFLLIKNRREAELSAYLLGYSPRQAELLSEAMQKYPEENFLNFQYTFGEFNKDNAIDSLFNNIADCSKWMITIISNETEVIYDYKDDYYGIPYKVVGKYDYNERNSILKSKLENKACLPLNQEKTPLSLISSIKRPRKTLPTKIHSKRRCLKSDLTKDCILMKKDCNRLINTFNFKNGKILHVFDQKLIAPKSHIKVILKCKNLRENYLNYEMHLMMAFDHFISGFANTNTSRTSIKAQMTPEGVVIEVSGFTKNAKEACESLIKVIKTTKRFNPEDFKRIKRVAVQKYVDRVFNISIFSLKDFLIDHIYGLKPFNERLKELENMKERSAFFFPNYYTEIIAVGNIDTKTVHELYENIKDTGTEVTSDKISDFKELAFISNIQSGDLISILFDVYDPNSIIQKRVFPESNDNGLVLKPSDQFAFSILKRRFLGHIIKDILDDIVEERFHGNGRTPNKVNCEILEIFGSEYLSLSVFSHREMDNTVKQDFIKFIEELPAYLKTVSHERFEFYKEKLINLLDEPVYKLEHLYKEITTAHSMGYFDYYSKDKFKLAINSLKLHDLTTTDLFRNYRQVVILNEEEESSD